MLISLRQPTNHCQFNFPDHTKLVLSSDAGYGHFLCLPLDATCLLEETGSVPWRHVKARANLRGSLQQLLYGSADKEDSYKELTESNLLRAKIEFIYAVVVEWCQQGALAAWQTPRCTLGAGRSWKNPDGSTGRV